MNKHQHPHQSRYMTSDFPEEPDYYYRPEFIAPAVAAICQRRPKSVAFDVVMVPCSLALKNLGDENPREVFADPLGDTTIWERVKPLDATGREALGQFDKKLIAQAGGYLMRDVLLHLHNETAYVVTCSGNALSSPQPVRVTAQLRSGSDYALDVH